jgi:16S rRNA (guanine527-N7)-methyltransferase
VPDPFDAVIEGDLDALVARFALLPESLGPLRGLTRILSGDPLAPTTVREPRHIVRDHLADSLVALELPEVRGAGMIADLGAGAGLPGLALAIALPAAHVHLVESVQRKCGFLEHTVAGLHLDNAAVVCARAEQWADGLGRCDLVTARALAPLDVVAEYAAPLLRLGGHLVAWRGKREPQVEADTKRAAQILGLCVHEPLAVKPYPEVEARYLHLMSKVMPTPPQFPRRPGVARKRQLGRRARTV